MLTDVWPHLHIITPIVGCCLFVLLAAIAWVVVQIRNFINQDFVEKIDCERCMNKARQDYRDDMDERYKSLENKIDEMGRRFDSEIKEVRTSTEQWIQTAVRIETKVDILLQNLKESK